MVNPKDVHVVEPGDRLSRIASLHGYASTDVVWDAPENAALRARRPNPEILMPGDRVFLPPRRGDAHAAPERKETRLARAGIRSELRLRLEYQGRPIVPRGRVYVVIDTDPYSPEAPYEGDVTLAEGLARFHIDPRVTEVKLVCEDPAFRLRLLVGHLQPVDEPTGIGVEQRLQNLGYRCPIPPRGRNHPGHRGERRLAPEAERSLARFLETASPAQATALREEGAGQASLAASTNIDGALGLLGEKSRA